VPASTPGHDPGLDPAAAAADQPSADLRRTRCGAYEITVRPGADPFELARVLVAVPREAVFVEAFGDSGAVLVFRPAPGAAGDARPAPPTPAPAGWVPEACALAAA
jgi:uncharacterized repeat protein (TIGR03917 family)